MITSAAGEKSVIMAERVGYRQCLTLVRALYLDLAQWAIEDPARWARWAAPCPVSQEEISLRKFARRRKARMDARTRERLPVLPVLVRTVDGYILAPPSQIGGQPYQLIKTLDGRGGLDWDAVTQLLEPQRQPPQSPSQDVSHLARWVASTYGIPVAVGLI